MLIGHRFERTAQGDLHIHSRNVVQSLVVWVIGALAFVLPMAFAVFVMVDGASLMAEVDPLSALLMVLLWLLIPALGLLLVVYTGVHETLVLSRVDGEGKRLTRNLFGRRERLQSAFRIDAAKSLELRRLPQAGRARTQLWLILRDGTAQRLTTDNVPVVPGSQRTDLWLRELADYLGVALPTEVVEGAAPVVKAPYRPTPAPTSGKAVRAARQRREKGDAAAPEPTEKLGVPARALLTLLGAFFAVLELTNVMTLVPAIFTGRLRVSGFRTGSTTFYWAEQPLSFSFNLLVGIAEGVIVGFIAWGCLRVAIQGRMNAKP
ncbi:hypothetical protein SAMN03159443_00091 [Pseudomonas sp. NFACC15-1]|uniref:hypothetical protein n=1 Tax=unclassified Pseudomonas TaxID=196821 RepID=UPI000889D1AC|nr:MULTISPECIES: hypothetical protein [unclassified Pseudomonas]SDA37915.1 hypothetical protein SAMN03159443_00091 [Pseudomonas sp. NFACC15-1]SDW21982.1 hypothetical protein SAMN03159380_00255 [Pseudomonas sp. NFACC14]